MEINQIDTRTQIHLLYLCATDIELLEVAARREVYLLSGEKIKSSNSNSGNGARSMVVSFV